MFLNIKHEMEKLKKYEKLFEKVQEETGEYIPLICEILTKYRGKMKRDGSNVDVIVQILKLIYEVLIIICCQHRKNQEHLNNFLSYFVEDIFLGLGAENILIEIFKGNYKVLCRASKPLAQYKNKNIIEATFEMIGRFSHQKNNVYWEKLLKIMQLLFVLIFDGESSIDVNQRIISEQFFGNEHIFVKLFFDIKIQSHRIKVEQETGRYIEIDQIRNSTFATVVEEVFKLFSMLAFHRNFISKKSIHSFLSAGCSNNIEVLIAYLNMPISSKLCSSLYSLITNLYIDSSPRINREKPLSVINFSFAQVSKSMHEENELSDRLKSALLFKVEESYQTKPLLISNLLAMSAKMSMEPTLSHE